MSQIRCHTWGVLSMLYEHLHKYKYSGSDFHRIRSRFLIFCSIWNYLSLSLAAFPSFSLFSPISFPFIYTMYTHPYIFCLLHTRCRASDTQLLWCKCKQAYGYGVWLCPIIPLIIHVEHLTITRNKREQYELRAVPIGEIYVQSVNIMLEKQIVHSNGVSIHTHTQYCWAVWIFVVSVFVFFIFFKVNESVHMQNTQWICWCHEWGCVAFGI